MVVHLLQNYAILAVEFCKFSHIIFVGIVLDYTCHGNNFQRLVSTAGDIGLCVRGWVKYRVVQLGAPAPMSNTINSGW